MLLKNLNKGISAKTGVEDDVNDDNLDLFPSAASKVGVILTICKGKLVFAFFALWV